MLLLTSTSDIVRVVTADAATIHAHASWVDNASGTITPGRTNTAAISTATTTTLVDSPGSSTQRNVRTLALRNAHASQSCLVTVQHYDGTNSEDLIAATLLAGETLTLGEDGQWIHRDSNGGEYAYSGAPFENLGLDGTIAETIPRNLCPEISSTVASSGQLFLQAIYLKAGQLVSNIILWSATTAAVSPTNYACGLYDRNRALLANSASKGSEAWGSNTQKTFAMNTPYRVPRSGLYYIGFYMAASTVVTLKGGTAKTGAQLAGGDPILQGTSSAGLSTVLPNPAAAITVTTANIYAAVT